ncbi:MAG: lipopolysaccharide kinase InaA family protein [Bacteroidota bacterium]
MKIKVSKPYNNDQILNLVNSFEREGETLSAGRNTIKIFKVNGKELNVKAFKIPHIINKIAYKYFRKSKAQRSFEYANYLLDHNILTPKPIAYIDQYDVYGLNKSFYISENLKYDLTFRELIYDFDYPEREVILSQFAEFTYNLHENGINFLDHSPGNTLIVKNGKGRYDFYLIDLNRMEFGKMSYKAKIKNFQRLGLDNKMGEIVGEKYAELAGMDSKKIIEDMKRTTKEFFENRKKKNELKKKLGLKKN